MILWAEFQRHVAQENERMLRAYLEGLTTQFLTVAEAAKAANPEDRNNSRSCMEIRRNVKRLNIKFRYDCRPKHLTPNEFKAVSVLSDEQYKKYVELRFYMKHETALLALVKAGVK